MKKDKPSKISKIIPAIIGGLLMSFVFRSCHNNNWLGTKEPTFNDKIEILKKLKENNGSRPQRFKNAIDKQINEQKNKRTN